jgi:hypothetical protein
MRWETLYNYVVGLAAGLLLFAWATAVPDPGPLKTKIKAVFHVRGCAIYLNPYAIDPLANNERTHAAGCKPGAPGALP